MSYQSPPLPTTDPLVDPQRQFRATRALVDWATALSGDVDTAPARLRTETLTGQTASIGTTAIPVGSLAAGLYRVSWYARITRAATTSSSLTVTIGWVESGITLVSSGAALTGNTTGTVQSGSLLLRIDAGTPITYSTTYASSGGVTMEYRLDLVVEQVDA